MNRVTKYANDVLVEKIVTGKYVKLACERHLKDLEKSKLAPYRYRFDINLANKIIDYSETLYIAEGEGKKQLKLYGFQDFILGSLFGWIDKETGYRRFKHSYIQIGRQNSKSFLNGVLGTYCGNFDGYNYAQIYCTATKADQAKIVLKEIIKFIEADNDLGELFEIKEYESTVKCKLTNSTIKALGRDTKSIDGFRPYLGIVDEYQAHNDNQMYKQLEGGTGNLDQFLISVITTAGFDLNGPCYKLYNYCCKLLEGVFENETRFVYIAQMDKEDDIWDSRNWIKANPLNCSSQKGIENIQLVANEVKQIGGADLRDFLTKRLNIWVKHTDDSYLDVESWEKCATDKTLADFEGQKCFVGLDLSSGGDLTSISVEIPFFEDERKKYFIESHSFIPKLRVEEHIKTDLAPYDIWIKERLITVTETLGGVKTDYKYILSYLKRIIEKYNLKIIQIGYDPHNADAFLADLEEFGDCVEIKQSCMFLNDVTNDFKLEVKAQNIEYNRKNSLLTWSAVNAITVTNSFGEIKIDKNLRQKRIDPVDSAICSHKLAFKSEEIVNINQTTEEYLEMMGW